MKVTCYAIVLAAAGAMLGGCSSDQSLLADTKQQVVEHVAAPYAQSAITLNITAEPGLNSWNDIASSCTVLVIQAQKASSLNRIMSNPAQLKSLYHGTGAEDNILKVDRYTMMPGKRTTLHIDRSEHTRNVAIVAGYYPFPKKQHMALITIPVTLDSSGWWSKSWSAKLSPIIIDLTLGSHSINHLSHYSTQAPDQTHAAQPVTDGKLTQGEE